VRRRTLDLSDATVVEAGWSVTPVARVSTRAHATRRFGFVRQHLRPLRVQVVGPGGGAQTIRVHDTHRTVQRLIVAAFALLVGLQAWRRRT